jgi:hypothetical protein
MPHPQCQTGTTPAKEVPNPPPGLSLIYVGATSDSQAAVFVSNELRRAEAGDEVFGFVVEVVEVSIGSEADKHPGMSWEPGGYV